MIVYKSLELAKPKAYRLEGLEIGVTSNCNFRCDYCCAYNRNDNESLTAEQIIRVLEDLPDLKRVRLSGGEVTLKFEDTAQIVAYCNWRGIRTQLNTNASLLDPARIDRLARAGLTAIHISFNFLSADSFAAYYRLHPALYTRITDNIAYCAGTKMLTVLETLLFSDTVPHIAAIHDRVYELGVRIHEIQNGIAMPHSGWSRIASEQNLRQSVALLLNRRREDMTLYFTCMDRFAERLGFREQPGVYFPHCIEGRTQLHLHGNGDVIISELCHPVVIGNIYNGLSLRDVYDRMPEPLADYLEQAPCPAHNALFGAELPGCAWSAHSENGN